MCCIPLEAISLTTNSIEAISGLSHEAIKYDAVVLYRMGGRRNISGATGI
jgi:hypothetical protein